MLKKYFPLISFSVLLLAVCISFIDIQQNGLNRTTLLDELFEDDIELVKYRKFQKYFKIENDLQLLVFRKDKKSLSTHDFSRVNTYTHQSLGGIDHLTIYHLDEISLPNYDGKKIQTTGLFIKNKVDEKVLNKIMKLKTFKQLLVSTDNKVINIKISLNNLDQDKKAREQVINQLKISMKSLESSTEYQSYLYGVENYRYSIYKEVKNSYLYLLPIIIVFISFVVYFIFKRISYLFAVYFTLGFSFISTAAIVYGHEHAFSPISSFSLLFVFVIGTSDIIHLLSVLSAQSEHISNKERLDFAVKKIYRPCLLTSITTFIGLFSLVLSDLKTLHLFGLYGCIGIVVCFIVTFHILPKGLALFKTSSFVLAKKKTQLIVVKYYLRHQRKIIGLGFIIIVFSLIMSSKIQFKDDFHNKFKNDHLITKSIQKFSQSFGYNHIIELFYDSRNIKSDVSLNEFIEKSKKLPFVSGLLSENQLAQDLNQQIKSKELATKITKYTSLIAPGVFSSQLNPYKKRIIVQVNTDTNTELETVTDSLKQQIFKSNLLGKLSLEGFTLFRMDYFDRLKINFMHSALFSCFFITLAFLIFFRSVKLTIIAMIVNIAPITVVMGLMSTLGITADLNLPLISSLLMGICVDDTIHFIYNFQQNRNSSGRDGIDSVLNKTLRSVTQPVVLTSILLSGTIIVFNLSEISLFSQLALLLSTGFLTAVLYDLFVLPALIALLDTSDQVGSK